MMGLGCSMVTAIFNVILYSKSLEHTEKLVGEIDRSIAIQGMITKLNQSPQAHVISINVKRTGEEHLSLGDMTDEELEKELNKAIAEENYERAVEIRAEKVRRK